MNSNQENSHADEHPAFDESGEYRPLSNARTISELRETEFYRHAKEHFEAGYPFEKYMQIAAEEVDAGLLLAIGESICAHPEFVSEIERKNIVDLLGDILEKTKDQNITFRGGMNHYRDAYRLAESLHFLGQGGFHTEGKSAPEIPEMDEGEQRIYQEIAKGKYKITSIFRQNRSKKDNKPTGITS